MTRLLIIADDLSGAADCSIACAGHGLNTIVQLHETEFNIDVDVLSIDGNTRSLTPANAAAETARLVRRYISNEDRLLFKKLDSTLRGHVAAELAAVLEARRSFVSDGRRIVCVMAPAFPSFGRTTANGRQLVHGRPLEHTEMWQREPGPANSNIAEMLRQAGLTCALIDTACVRSSHGLLENAMTRFASYTDVLICDAETDADLRAIATASIILGPHTVWAGSAGLAYHLPHAARFASVPLSIPDEPLAKGPTIFVVGSNSSASRHQALLLGAAPDVITICVSQNTLIAGARSPAWLQHQQHMERAIAAGADMVVMIGEEHSVENETGQLLSAALARLVQPFTAHAGALVATGGETARSVLEAWGIACLRLVGELETGVPVSVTEGWNRRLPVLTKAGAFGTPQTLLHCREFLRKVDRASAKNLDQH
jgi:uncharacterized protein YgbK (DUF1537 family)